MRVHFILLFFIAGGTFCFEHNEEESCSQPGDSCIISTKECPSIPLLSQFRPFLPRCELKGSTTTLSVCCSKLLPFEVCSRRPSRVRMSSRISAGQEAKRSDWPWIVAVGFYNRSNEAEWFCGGSLLNERFVLSAAHCKTNFKRILYHVVRLGDLDLANDGDMKHVDIRAEYIIHKDYIKGTAVNDIALLKLASRVTFNDNILPVCLPLGKQLPTDYIDKQALVAGWGWIGDQIVTTKLMETDVTVKSISVCNDIIGLHKEKLQNENLSSDMWICTESEVDKKDTCRGDSGGPIMVELNGAYYQVGIVSQGSKRECGSTENEGLYMNISKYLPWIYENMESNNN